MIRLPPKAVMANGLALNSPPIPSIMSFTFCSARKRSGAAL
jgi:hypothetical protein